MSKNVINYKKIDELKNSIALAKDNILSDVEKLKQQIENLADNYNDKAAIEVYDILVNEKLVSIKKGCNKMEKMGEILTCITLAYKDLEERSLSSIYKENE